MKQRIFPAVFLAALLMSGGCDRGGSSPGPQYGSKPVSRSIPVYVFAVHPLHNPQRLFRTYQPLVNLLNSQLKNARLKLEASRDYADFERKYRDRIPHFILPNPWQTLQAIDSGYHVIASAGEASDFRGVFIVRKDSRICRPADLKGKAISYPSPTALAACIMPQYFLYLNGVDIKRDVENRYVGSQESSIMNAYLGLTAAGATWPPPWRAFQHDHPREAAELKVAWETEPLINNSVMARNDVTNEVRDQLKLLLANLHKTAAGRAILAGIETARFLPAGNLAYEPVKHYLTHFETAVRKVAEP